MKSRRGIRIPTAPPTEKHIVNRPRRKVWESKPVDDETLAMWCTCGHDIGYHTEGMECVFEVDNDVWCSCCYFEEDK